ncbi:MAG: HAMP domain-containing sensor histidine kinase [Chryseolinea sp.]
MIGRVAALDFSKTLSISDKNDMIDAIGLGLNMLSEELNTNVVERSKLDTVNSKLEKFAYTTAHDLRSPLNSITGLVTLLELTINPEENSEVHQYVVRLKKTTEQMKNLVQGILEYSIADTSSIEKQEIDLNEVFKEVIEIDQLSDCAIIKIENTLPKVVFNRSTMDQIIRNLLSNAIKYSDKKNCEITIRAKEADDHVLISICDNGPGIAKENQEKIFELFNKIDNESKIDSHGIGLATVKSVLEAVGEKIWVESTLNEGATFCFTLKKEKQGKGTLSGQSK